MRVALLTAITGCAAVDPCAESPLDDRCAGELQLDLEDDALRFLVRESLVVPDRLSMWQLLECDEGSSLNDIEGWWVVDLGSALVSEGLEYGVVPEGATEKDPAPPLLAGATYGVKVNRYDLTGPSWTLWFVPDLGQVERMTEPCPSWWPTP